MTDGPASDRRAVLNPRCSRQSAGGRLRHGGMEAVSRSILVFYVPMLIVLALVTYLPALSLWLPSVVLR